MYPKLSKEQAIRRCESYGWPLILGLHTHSAVWANGQGLMMAWNLDASISYAVSIYTRDGEKLIDRFNIEA